MGGVQLVESRCARSGLGCDIHFELLLRGESRGGFYFLIQDDKGEKVTGETAWTVAQAWEHLGRLKQEGLSHLAKGLDVGIYE